MGERTNLGCGIWNWAPFVDLDYQTRNLWLGLYSSAEAKRLVPGLWHGGIGTMADACRMQPDEVLTSLDRLIERDLAEYDQRCRVLRLIQLPDAFERAHNAKAVKGWWNRFITVPKCDVRDAHIETLWSLLTQGSRPQEMLDAWNTSFAKITIPKASPRRQRLIDSDTGTTTQPSLFGSHQYSKITNTSGRVSIPLGIGSGSGSGSLLPEGNPDLEAGPGEDRDREADAPAPGRWTNRVRLQLVPAEPESPPRDRAAEERDAYREEMKRAAREACEQVGGPTWITESMK